MDQWRPRKSGELLEVAQLVSGRAGVLSQVTGSKSLIPRFMVFLNPEELLHLLVMQFFPGVLE